MSKTLSVAVKNERLLYKAKRVRQNSPVIKLLRSWIVEGKR